MVNDQMPARSFRRHQFQTNVLQCGADRIHDLIRRDRKGRRVQRPEGHEVEALVPLDACLIDNGRIEDPGQPPEPKDKGIQIHQPVLEGSGARVLTKGRYRLPGEQILWSAASQKRAYLETTLCSSQSIGWFVMVL